MKESLFTATVFYLVLLSGCASVTTRGRLPDVPTFPTIAGARKSVTVRAYTQLTTTWESGDKTGSVSYERMVAAEEGIKQAFQESGAFSEVVFEPLSVEEFSFDKPDDPIARRFIDNPLKVFHTDYFIDLVNVRSEDLNSPMPWVYICLPSMISIGFLPCPNPVQINLEARVYSKGGVIRSTHKADDSGMVWRWTPFLLLPSSTKFMKKKQYDAAAMMVKAVRNALNDLLKAGVLK